jgi:hypothetical protein
MLAYIYRLMNGRAARIAGAIQDGGRQSERAGQREGEPGRAGLLARANLAGLSVPLGVLAILLAMLTPVPPGCWTC